MGNFKQLNTRANVSPMLICSYVGVLTLYSRTCYFYIHVNIIFVVSQFSTS